MKITKKEPEMVPYLALFLSALLAFADQIIKLLDDWKGQQKEHEKPEKKTEKEK